MSTHKTLSLDGLFLRNKNVQPADPRKVTRNRPMPFQNLSEFDKSGFGNNIFDKSFSGLQKNSSKQSPVGRIRAFVLIFLHWSIFRLYILIPLTLQIIVLYFSMIRGPAICIFTQNTNCAATIVNCVLICILTKNTNCVATIVNYIVLIIVDIYDFPLQNNDVCKIRRYSRNIYTPVEENQDEKHEFHLLETTIQKLFSSAN